MRVSVDMNFLFTLGEVQPTFVERDRRRELTLYDVDVAESIVGDHEAQRLLGRLGDPKPFFCMGARRRELPLFSQRERQPIAREDGRARNKAEALAA